MLQYPPNTYPPNSYPPNVYQQNTYQQQDIHQQQNVCQQQNTYTTQQNTITTSTITTNANNHVAKEMETCCCCFPLKVGVAFICVLELLVGIFVCWIGFAYNEAIFHKLNGVLCICAFFFGLIAITGQKKSHMNGFRIFYVVKTIFFIAFAVWIIVGLVNQESDIPKIAGVRGHREASAFTFILCAFLLLAFYFNMVIMKFYDYLYKHSNSNL